MEWYERRKLYRYGRWQKLRLKVFRRDGFRCVKCGRAGRLECDHIKPHTDSTTIEKFHDMDNLQTLCRGCHIGKTALENSLRHQKQPQGEEEVALLEFVRELENDFSTEDTD